jgi:hypothetical protein
MSLWRAVSKAEAHETTLAGWGRSGSLTGLGRKIAANSEFFREYADCTRRPTFCVSGVPNLQGLLPKFPKCHNREISRSEQGVEKSPGRAMTTRASVRHSTRRNGAARISECVARAFHPSRDRPSFRAAWDGFSRPVQRFQTRQSGCGRCPLPPSSPPREIFADRILRDFCT